MKITTINIYWHDEADEETTRVKTLEIAEKAANYLIPYGVIATAVLGKPMPPLKNGSPS